MTQKLLLQCTFPSEYFSMEGESDWNSQRHIKKFGKLQCINSHILRWHNCNNNNNKNPRPFFRCWDSFDFYIKIKVGKTWKNYQFPCNLCILWSESAWNIKDEIFCQVTFLHLRWPIPSKKINKLFLVRKHFFRHTLLTDSFFFLFSILQLDRAGM